MIGSIAVTLLLLPTCVVLGLPTLPRADTTETVGPRWISLSPDFHIPGDIGAAILNSTSAAPLSPTPVATLPSPSPDSPTDPAIIARARTSSASLHQKRARIDRKSVV